MKLFFNQTTNIGLVLFIILAFYNIGENIQSDITRQQEIEIVKKQLQRIDSNSNIVLELQRERGLTNIYFANPTEKHLQKMLSQRVQSSKGISEALLKKSLETIRKQVDDRKVERVYTFNYYSQLIRDLLLDTKSLTYSSEDKSLKNELMIYNDLNTLQEILGQLREKVGLVLSSNTLTPEAAADVVRSNILFGHQLETTFVNDLLSSRKYTRKISKEKCLKKSFLISKTLELELAKGDARVSAIEWFKISTCAIDTINGYVNEQLKIINEHIEIEIETSSKKRVYNLIFWLFGFTVLAIFVYIAFRRSKELQKEQALLQNYKRAIDYSTMVSTTDKNGVITHVNEIFTATSGYTELEIRGKNYSLTRHPNTDEDIRTEITKHLMCGESWSGLLEYRKKDGSSFWADTYIMPIFDDENELVEYITIMCDISEIISLQGEIQDTQRELLYRLGEAVESRNKESGNHIKRVALYSELLAKLSKLSKSKCDTIFSASTMHDVGKIAIPDAILLKPGKLNESEWEIMKTHSEIGYKLFKDSKRTLLKAAAEVSYEHHEYYNGKGYPQGLKGEEISIFGRIVAITDVFDALASRRPYKEPWPIEKIVELLKEESGKQFDPNLVKLFLDNLDKFVAIRNKYEDKQ